MRLQRLIMIILYLQMHDVVTISELSSFLEVSKRTVSRDIEILKTAGIEVESRLGTAGGYYLSKDYAFESSLFTKSELKSILLGTQFLNQFKNTEFAKEAEELYCKISKLVKSNVDSNSESSQFMLFDFGNKNDLEYKTEMALISIERAYNNQKLLWLEYTSLICKRHSTLGKVAPYGIVNKSGYWYLVGYCYVHKEYRVFNIMFIQKMDILEESYEKDTSFHLDTFWNKTNN